MKKVSDELDAELFPSSSALQTGWTGAKDFMAGWTAVILPGPQSRSPLSEAFGWMVIIIKLLLSTATSRYCIARLDTVNKLNILPLNILLKNIFCAALRDEQSVFSFAKESIWFIGDFCFILMSSRNPFLLEITTVIHCVFEVHWSKCDKWLKTKLRCIWMTWICFRTTKTMREE